VHVGDREADIYDFFQAAEEDKSHYLARIKVDRRTEDETKTIKDVMKNAKVRGRYKVQYKDADGKTVEAVLKVKFEEITIKPPFGIKTKTCSDTKLTVIHANEVSAPAKGREAIDWKLVTNLPVKSLADATEKLQWYALRWKIEVFFKILKSSFKVEDSKLRTAESLCKLIAVFSVMAWRLFWMTMINRSSDSAPAQVALSKQEMKILDILKPNFDLNKKPTLATYLLKIARLGGYLARAHDPPPGNIVMWRGMARLSEIQIGVEIGIIIVGN
jgi:IS4 transposase